MFKSSRVQIGVDLANDMPCDPKQLATDSFCLRDNIGAEKEMLGAILYILCQKTGLNCTPEQLADLARPFALTMSQNEILAAILLIFCQNAGFASGQILQYVNDPNVEGLEPFDINSPAVAYTNPPGGTMFNWDPVNHVWA